MAAQTPPTEEPAILVVEDDLNHEALIQAVFAYRRFPCTLQITETSEEAKDYFLGRWPFWDRTRHPYPDVVILDVGLPGMGGLEFLAWLNERPEAWAHVPVIIFTASEDPEVAARGRRLGATEVMVKPADFTELVDLVADTLRRVRPNIA